jgi:hypothetical protein
MEPNALKAFAVKVIFIMGVRGRTGRAWFGELLINMRSLDIQ